MKRVEESAHARESNLYDQQLESYIRNYLDQGYTPKQLQDYLVEKGYDKKSVRKAVLFINKTYYDNKLELHKPSSSTHILSFLILGLIVLSIGVFFYFEYPSSYEFFITIENQELAQGDSLEFIIGTTRPVKLEILVSTVKGDFILQQTDSFKSSTSHVLDLPDDLLIGEYVVDIAIFYKNNRDDKSFSFSVLDKSLISPSKLNIGLQFKQIIESSEYSNCAVLSNQFYRNECYFVFARDTLDESICIHIDELDKRDNCYLTQVLNGNKISCLLLLDARNKVICENLS